MAAILRAHLATSGRVAVVLLAVALLPGTISGVHDVIVREDDTAGSTSRGSRTRHALAPAALRLHDRMLERSLALAHLGLELGDEGERGLGRLGGRSGRV
jgi:hypothetical protein